MSVFNSCEICGEFATFVFDGSSTLHFYCENHSRSHRGSRDMRCVGNSFCSLSPQEPTFLREAFEVFKRHYLKQSLIRRKSKIESLYAQIRMAEEEYSLDVQSLLELESMYNQLCTERALPCYSENPLLQSLHSLKVSSDLTIESIKQKLFIFNSSLHSLPHLPSQLPKYQKFREIKAHSDTITSVAVSDGQRYFASGSYDKTVKLWDLETLKQIYHLKGHKKSVESVTFWGDKVISGSEDGSIKIWEGGRCINTLSLHSEAVNSLCVSHFTRLLVSGSADKQVIVFNLEENIRRYSLLGHSEEVNSVAFSPSDREIVSGSRDRSIKVWKTENGDLLRILNGHSLSIISVFFLGNLLVSSSSDKTIKIWVIEEEESILTLAGHSSQVIRVDGSNNMLVSMGMDKEIRTWDIRNKHTVQVLEPHRNSSNKNEWGFRALKFAKEGQFIISGEQDQKLILWEKVR